MSIAIQCGYYDYQHLVKDYKDFTQCSPNDFHALENKAPERAFGLSEVFIAIEFNSSQYVHEGLHSTA